MKKQQGFTLIELLVVIAIIGLLSTLAVLSFGGVREKARDSQRLSDIKQLSTILEIEESNNAATPVATCTAANAKTTTCDGPGEVSQFSKFVDPSADGAGTACSAMTAAGTCDYSIVAAAATTDNYDICFYMEAASNLGTAGYYTISQGGTISVVDATPATPCV